MTFRHLCRLGRLGSASSKLVLGSYKYVFEPSFLRCSSSRLRLSTIASHSYPNSSILAAGCFTSTRSYDKYFALPVNNSSYNSQPLLINLHPTLCVRHFSIFPKRNQDSEVTKSDEQPKKTILQRFKDAYKEYGKVLIAFHVVTSVAWFGIFYYAAYSGVDIVPLLEKLGFGEKVTTALGKPGIGHVAVAYLLYKLASPVRYTTTIVGTQVTVKQLRKLGYMQPISKEDSIRSLFKEGRSQVRERYDDMKGEARIKMLARREKFTREINARRENFKSRHERLRQDLERQVRLRRQRLKNGRNGHKL